MEYTRLLVLLFSALCTCVYVESLDTVSCDFSVDTCGWRQDNTDGFDWTRHRGNTSTPGTGPNGDHTTGDGYYVYIEASTHGLHAGDKARLISPVFHLLSSRAMCFSFWYNMHGHSIAELDVYRHESGSRALLWSRTGNQSPIWQKAEVTLTGTGGLISLTIEADAGARSANDIAVDDMELYTRGSCESRATVSCDFSDGPCGWSLSSSNNFYWLLHKGRGLTLGTGPNSDHTSGSGTYMVIDTSYPAYEKPGDKAYMVSPPIQIAGTQHMCFTFWYFYYGHGTHPAKLNVYAHRGGTQSALPPVVTGNPVASILSFHGRQWLDEHVTLTGPGPITIVMEGISEDSPHTDIAVDDFTILPGPCRNGGSSINCDFAFDLCGWSQDKTDQLDWIRHSGSTPTTHTGPTGDHRTGAGHYLYIETSTAALRTGDQGRLVSPTIHLPGVHNMCFTFWYYMYGSTVSDLNVYVRNTTSLGRPIWTQSGNKGHNWFQAQVPLSGAGDVQVVIEGLVGSNGHSDIAIDDTLLLSGDCIGSGKLRCLHCDEITHPHECRKVAACNKGQECFIKEFINGVGATMYQLGCMDSGTCDTTSGNVSRSSFPPVGKRSSEGTGTREILTKTDGIRTSPEHVTCMHCCDSDFCNIDKCTAPILDGIRCGSCQGLHSPAECDTLELCSPDDRCFVQTEPHATSHDFRYRLGCVKDIQCQALVSLDINHCVQCCGTPFCNFYGCSRIGNSSVSTAVSMVGR